VSVAILSIPTRYMPNDEDARAYVNAVQDADKWWLEVGVAKAIDDFVIGCKADSIWTPLKASCLLAGPRTLAGCLVPLVGSAPTNNGFVSADVNRKTGFLGNAATKNLDTNRLGTADPQDNMHVAVWVSALSGNFQVYIGSGAAETGCSQIISGSPASDPNFRCRNSTAIAATGGAGTGFIGMSRASSTQYSRRANGTTVVETQTSQTPVAKTYRTHARESAAGVVGGYSNARIAFYSAGESLSLSLLDARLTTYMAAIGAAIP
jgi:hypothetical protein